MEIIPPRKKIRIDFEAEIAPELPDFNVLTCEVCGKTLSAIGHRNFRWKGDAWGGDFEVTGSRVEICYHCASRPTALYHHGASHRDHNYLTVAKTLAVALGRGGAP